MDIERRLHGVAQRLVPAHLNGGYPPLVVWFCRHPPIVVDEAGLPKLPLAPDPRLLDAASKLGALCDFLIIGSNTGDVLRESISREAARPVVSIIEATLAEVRRRGWRRVGVLALGDGAMYCDPLVADGIVCETPDADARGAIARAAFGVMEGRNDAADRSVIRNALDDLRRRSLDGVVLGCTELPLLVGEEADTAADVINSNQMIAEAAVAYAIAP